MTTLTKEKRLHWKLGKIETLYIGKDKNIRGAKVSISNNGKISYINRPINKLIPLEVRNVNEEKSEIESNDKRDTVDIRFVSDEMCDIIVP